MKRDDLPDVAKLQLEWSQHEALRDASVQELTTQVNQEVRFLQLVLCNRNQWLSEDDFRRIGNLIFKAIAKRRISQFPKESNQLLANLLSKYRNYFYQKLIENWQEVQLSKQLTPDKWIFLKSLLFRFIRVIEQESDFHKDPIKLKFQSIHNVMILSIFFHINKVLDDKVEQWTLTFSPNDEPEITRMLSVLNDQERELLDVLNRDLPADKDSYRVVFDTSEQFNDYAGKVTNLDQLYAEMNLNEKRSYVILELKLM